MVPDAAQPVPNHESSSPLIRTKLHRPPLPSDYVCRDRLLDQMDKAMDVPLTLVSAGAGAGKSVIVAAWLEDRGHPYAWLSLDGSDSRLRRFLSYLVAGTGVAARSRPRSDRQQRNCLDSPELPPVDRDRNITSSTNSTAARAPRDHCSRRLSPDCSTATRPCMN